MKRTLLGVVLALTVISSTQAQFVQDPDDFGAADTLELVITVKPDATTNQLDAQAQLWAFNDSNDVASASVGFKWLNTNLSMDSAYASPLAQSSFNLNRFFYDMNQLAVTNANDRFLFAGVRISGNGVVRAPARRLWATYDFTLSSWDACDSILLDTLTFNSGTVYKFVDASNRNYNPFWAGLKIVKDTACVPPANILINPDTLYYSAIVGQGNPPTQTTQITSDGRVLSFTLIEAVPWITKSPSSGSTPSTIIVGVNTTAMAAGTYLDSIAVNVAVGALNSPQFIYVQLQLDPPAPRIKVLPTSLSFTGVVGSGNPASKVLTITNIGGSVLQWSLSNSQTWLSTSPSSGTDSGQSTVSIDITGLTIGTHYDTVVVSDPAALNNPVKVPVTLTLGSNLPTIETDSTFLYFNVNPNEAQIFNRSFEVRNGGVGLLRYRATENTPNILSITNDTGTAPQTLTLNYKIISGAFEGNNVYDTITITSDDAINSPYTVIVQLHFTANPSIIGLMSDTLYFSLYECPPLSLPEFGTQQFQVFNGGGDDPVFVNISYESELFTLEQSVLELPGLVTATGVYTGLPAGVYLDTITLSYIGATNSPRHLIVKYSVLDGTETPVITLSETTLELPYQEEMGPRAFDGFTIQNGVPGCLDWEASEDIDWFNPVVPSGTTPSLFDYIVEAPGYTLGQYYDTLYISSTGATNDSVAIPIVLKVWRFHGDMDYDGRVDIGDITIMISYLFIFAGDPAYAPQPEVLVGDVNCDNAIDISDLTLIIQYVFLEGPPLCGNPF